MPENLSSVYKLIIENRYRGNHIKNFSFSYKNLIFCNKIAIISFFFSNFMDIYCKSKT